MILLIEIEMVDDNKPQNEYSVNEKEICLCLMVSSYIVFLFSVVSQ